MAAQPEIEKRVEKMVANHRWVPAGYKARYKHFLDVVGSLIFIIGEIWRSIRVVDRNIQYNSIGILHAKRRTLIHIPHMYTVLLEFSIEISSK